MQPKCSYSLYRGDFVSPSQSVQRDFVSLGLMGFQPMALHETSSHGLLIRLHLTGSVLMQPQAFGSGPKACGTLAPK